MITMYKWHALLQNIIRIIQEKPFSVILFKLKQESIIALYGLCNVWAVINWNVHRRWTNGRISKVGNAISQSENLLLTKKLLVKFRLFVGNEGRKYDHIEANYHDFENNIISIFGKKIDINEIGFWPWSTDWRYGKTWKKRYFTKYNFYEFDKEKEYDVKFPWEVSRLNFLTLPALRAVFHKEEKCWSKIEIILDDWIKNNPVGMSIGWKPMECSMRGINLYFLTLAAAHSGDRGMGALWKLIPLCEIHGRFLYNTVEYTDIRGNHFAANIVALHLIGSLLKDAVPVASKWMNYGSKYIRKEIFCQYLPDGVQFEKSIPYHRLVTQLFLIGILSMKKHNEDIDEDIIKRLSRACYYTKCYSRFDGSAPMWGDNDDARALWFDSMNINDHRNLLALGGAVLNDRGLFPEANSEDIYFDAELLVGDDLENLITGSEEDNNNNNLNYFSAGGMVCYSDENSYFIADVGEIGLCGRGGHGHLDMTSFEFALNKVQLIVDPGSYIYTGNPVERNKFRSTSSHNVVKIDNEEIASLPAQRLWRLGQEADPYDVVVNKLNTGFEISASHDGFRRLASPVGYSRKFHFQDSMLIVSDHFEMIGSHSIERFFHLDKGLNLELKGETKLIVSRGKYYFSIVWDMGAEAIIIDDFISINYGNKIQSKTLILRNTAEHNCILSLEITRIS